MTNQIPSEGGHVVFHVSSDEQKPVKSKIAAKSKVAFDADRYAKAKEVFRLAEREENSILKLFPHLTSTEKAEFSKRIRNGQESHKMRHPLKEADKTSIIKDLILSAKTAEVLSPSGKREEPKFWNATQQAEQRAAERVHKARLQKKELAPLAPIEESPPQDEEAAVVLHVKKEEPPRWVKITKKEERLLKKEEGGWLFRKKEDASKEEKPLPPVAEQLDELEKPENPEVQEVLNQLHYRQKKLTRQLDKAELNAELKQARAQIKENSQRLSKTDRAKRATLSPVTKKFQDLKAKHKPRK